MVYTIFGAAVSALVLARRWVQAECRNLGEYDAPEVDPTLTAAVAALRDRPVLFKYCAEEVRGLGLQGLEGLGLTCSGFGQGLAGRRCSCPGTALRR